MDKTMWKSGDKGDRCRFSRTIPPAPLKLIQSWCWHSKHGNAVLRRQARPPLLCAELGLPSLNHSARVITSALPMVGAGGKRKRAVRDICPERLVCLVYVTAHALLRCVLPPSPHPNRGRMGGPTRISGAGESIPEKR
ncbi:hypothetical protein H0178_21825 [Cytobacillus firmus]|nr:hypothetical protein [Cytobacillus firmus]